MLSPNSLREGVSYLSVIDPDFAKVVADYGNPPLWSRKPGFPTLIHIILEQQVSLASARAVFTKLEVASDQLTPERFLAFTDTELRGYGFSRQKTKYCRALSKAILNGNLDLVEIGRMSDTQARNTLMKVQGIGPWTADIYLLMALLRPDIWPSGDLALAKAVQAIKNLPERPTPESLTEISERWKPWRAVAARLLWHHYLNQ